MKRKDGIGATVKGHWHRPLDAGDWIVIGFIVAALAMKGWFWLAGP